MTDVAVAPPANNPPPGMLQYWTNGFDMRTFGFATAAIFNPTYTNPAHKICYGGNPLVAAPEFRSFADFLADQAQQERVGAAVLAYAGIGEPTPRPFRDIDAVMGCRR